MSSLRRQLLKFLLASKKTLNNSNNPLRIPFPRAWYAMQKVLCDFKIAKSACVPESILNPKSGYIRHVPYNRENQPMTNKGSQSWSFKKSMGAWHRVGIGLSYRTARLHRLAELMP